MFMFISASTANAISSVSAIRYIVIAAIIRDNLPPLER